VKADYLKINLIIKYSDEKLFEQFHALNFTLYDQAVLKFAHFNQPSNNTIPNHPE